MDDIPAQNGPVVSTVIVVVTRSITIHKEQRKPVDDDVAEPVVAFTYIDRH